MTFIFAARCQPLAWSLLLSLFVSACATTVSSEALLAESVAWYTGTTGRIDDPHARELLERAAATGEPLPVMWMARVHSTGRMTFPRDEARARAIAEEVIEEVAALAAAGNAEAQFLMGTAWAEGLGKPVDAELAAQWYRAAADQGHMLARHNLGNSYAAGRGVPQDDALAVYWWQFAADAGDAVPQFMLGTMYEAGRGVTADPDMALHWYGESASRGYPRAIAALERLQE